MQKYIAVGMSVFLAADIATAVTHQHADAAPSPVVTATPPVTSGAVEPAADSRPTSRAATVSPVDEVDQVQRRVLRREAAAERRARQRRHDRIVAARRRAQQRREQQQLREQQQQEQALHPGCTATNWRSTMTADEVWIDTRESGLNPLARNPSGAFGLGQLKGYPVTSDPCLQLTYQRQYIAQRYGSEAAAVAYWESHGWY